MISSRSVKKRSLVTRILDIVEKKRTSDRIILRFLLFLFVISGVFSLLALNDRYLATTPIAGGTLVEGIIGTPRFVNPVLAVTRADLDMTALIYSGLMKINPEGELVPHLAESVTINDTGTVYNIIMRRDVRFHDGTPLTARDVTFTIALAQDATLKSPLRGNWVDIVVEEINEYELNIVLEEGYAPFIENLTLGILPRHIWSELPVEQIPFSERNTNPIGAGPFSVKSISRNKSGIIESYTLARSNYAVEPANIAGVQTFFYASENELVNGYNTGQFHSSAYLPSTFTHTLVETKRDVAVAELSLPRVFAVFINQNRTPALRDLGARQALSAAINREAIVENALYNYGVPTTHPLPAEHFAVQSTSSTPESTDVETNITITPHDRAVTILETAGWRKNDNGIWEKRIGGDLTPLQVTLRTTNNTLFEQVAQSIARDWRAIGVEVQLEQFEQTDLLQNVIRPREYQTLLFGIEMGRTIDLYPFWHSSQREDPGLNIAQYANIEVDSLLSRARSTTDSDIRKQSTNEAITIITSEYPAIFLFTPTSTYVTPNTVLTSPILDISRPHERFMNISQWHMNTDTVWPFFR
ncbi:MAG: ABC transporter substrate-binding protein [Candidatus Paceibacteria bacterium]